MGSIVANVVLRARMKNPYTLSLYANSQIRTHAQYNNYNNWDDAAFGANRRTLTSIGVNGVRHALSESRVANTLGIRRVGQQIPVFPVSRTNSVATAPVSTIDLTRQSAQIRSDNCQCNQSHLPFRANRLPDFTRFGALIAGFAQLNVDRMGCAHAQ
jgi:hypothetical protein